MLRNGYSGALRAVAVAEISGLQVQQTRSLGRRQPKQGKPPILPPSKKVLYHVVNAPWQKPEDVEELLWRRHVYNNAVTSLRDVFRQELEQNASIGRGIDSMKEAESNELDELIAENERRNREKAEKRAAAETEHTKATKLAILEEIEGELEKMKDEKKAAEREVLEVLKRSREFVEKENLETKILEALENPAIYDFAIDRSGNKFFVPEPVKYQEGTPTRQKGRIYDQTLGVQDSKVVEKVEGAVEPVVEKAN